MPSTQ